MQIGIYGAMAGHLDGPSQAPVRPRNGGSHRQYSCSASAEHFTNLQHFERSRARTTSLFAASSQCRSPITWDSLSASARWARPATS